MTHYARWSRASARPIELRFRTSVWLSVGLPLAHLLLAAALLAMPGILIPLAVAVMLAMSLVACQALPGVAWSRSALVSACSHDDDSWTLTERCGRTLAARLRGGWVVAGLLIMLSWETDRGERLAVLLPHSAAPAALARLRALLTIRYGT